MKLSCVHFRGVHPFACSMWSYATRSKAPNGTLMAVVTAAVLIEPPEMLILLLSNGSSQTAAEVVAPVAQHIFVEKLSSFLTFLEKYTPIYTDINGIVLNAKWDVPVLTVVCRTMSNGYKATAVRINSRLNSGVIIPMSTQVSL